MINKTNKLKGVLSDIYLVCLGCNKGRNNIGTEDEDQNKKKDEQNQRR